MKEMNPTGRQRWKKWIFSFTRFGKIPLEKAFRGSRFPFVPGQLSGIKAKQSARFVLAKEEDDFSPHRSLSENRQEGEETIESEG